MHLTKARWYNDFPNNFYCSASLEAILSQKGQFGGTQDSHIRGCNFMLH